MCSLRLTALGKVFFLKEKQQILVKIRKMRYTYILIIKDKLKNQEDLKQRDDRVQKLKSEYKKSLEELKRENEELKKKIVRSPDELETQDHPMPSVSSSPIPVPRRSVLHFHTHHHDHRYYS